MSKVARSRVVGPLADYADRFRLTLAGMGYTLASAEIHAWLMGRLSRWLLAEGLQPGELGAPEVVRFLAVHGAGRKRVPTERTLRPMLGYLRSLGVVPTPSLSSPLTPLGELLERYRRWLVDERGLAVRTVGRYEVTARRFLSERAGSAGGATGVDGLTGSDVVGFPAARVHQTWCRLGEGAAGRTAVAAAILVRAGAYLLGVGRDRATGGGLARYDIATDVDGRAGARRGLRAGLAASETKREIIRTVADIKLLRAGKGNRKPFGRQCLDWKWKSGAESDDAAA